jgi:AmmeMemoRadiSam system protein A
MEDQKTGDALTSEERLLLLKMARQALNSAVCGEALLPLDLLSLPLRLQAPGATFVTLTRKGELRGCIGALDPYLPLAEDVRQHAIAAGLQDYRFPPVDLSELPEIEIEISRLTTPVLLEYRDAEDLLSKLRPQIDGVVMRDGYRRATFLPQVWSKLPSPASFLNHLCQKMGGPYDLWRSKKLQVFVYQVEEFCEEHPSPTAENSLPR